MARNIEMALNFHKYNDTQRNYNEQSNLFRQSRACEFVTVSLCYHTVLDHSRNNR